MNLTKAIFFLCFFVFSSCISNRKVVYLQDEEFNYEQFKLLENRKFTYRLQPRDVLSVRIKTLDEESSDYFNLEPTNGFQQINVPAFYVNGYTVSTEDFISLPEVGKVKVGQLTLEEAETVIQAAVRKYLPNASVIVKLVSFKISVLGEVNNPGYYYIFNEQATVLEALALAGDLTDFGNRENIMLIRQVAEGSAAKLINLRDPTLVASSNYYLLPNDVIYVQPLKQKNMRDNLSNLTLLSVLFGAISAGVLLLNYSNTN